MLIEFQRFDCDDTQLYMVDPTEIVCVREYRERRAYGREQEVSQLTLRGGKEMKVSGHIAERIKSWQREIEAHHLESQDDPDRDRGRWT